MMSPKPDATNQLFRAGLVSLALSIVFLGGLIAVERYGLGLVLGVWVVSLIGLLLAGPRIDLPKWTKSAILKTSLMPKGQLFPDADSMQSQRAKFIHHAAEGRREAELEYLMKSRDIKQVRQGVAAMKNEGYWPYYALRLLAYSQESTTHNTVLLLLEEGAYLPRYNSSYEPATFQSVRFFDETIFSRELLDHILSLGADINDVDIQGRNLIEKAIDAMGDRCKVYSHLVGSSAAVPFLDLLTQLFEMGSRVRPEYCEQLAQYETRFEPVFSEQITTLVGKMRSENERSSLDITTKAISGKTRIARL